MNLASRLQDLCDRGKRNDAITLAKATLQNTRDVRVEVDDADVHVYTDRFEGTHGWYVNSFDEVVVEQQGEYTYREDGVELSFSTVTMNDRAHELAMLRLDGIEDEH